MSSAAPALVSDPVRATIETVSQAMRERARIRWSQQREHFLKMTQNAQRIEEIEASYSVKGPKFSNLVAKTLLTLYLEEAYAWQERKKL